MEKKSLIINSCGIVSCSPWWRWDTSKVKFEDYDLWSVFSGRGTIKVNDEIFTIEAGDCFLLPPKCTIIGENSPQDPLLTINVHFNFFKDGKPAFDYPLSKHHISDSYFFKKILERVITSYYQDCKENAIYWLEVALKEYFSSLNSVLENSLSQTHATCIETICNRINESFDKEISLEAFANEFGYSTSYLGRIFHKITGVSFSQYRINVKLNQAKSLLRTMNISILEIAEKLNYYDSGHFIKQFKAHIGITPDEYRKHYKGNC